MRRCLNITFHTKTAKATCLTHFSQPHTDAVQSERRPLWGPYCEAQPRYTDPVDPYTSSDDDIHDDKSIGSPDRSQDFELHADDTTQKGAAAAEQVHRCAMLPSRQKCIDPVDPSSLSGDEENDPNFEGIRALQACTPSIGGTTLSSRSSVNPQGSLAKSQRYALANNDILDQVQGYECVIWPRKSCGLLGDTTPENMKIKGAITQLRAQFVACAGSRHHEECSIPQKILDHLWDITPYDEPQRIQDLNWQVADKQVCHMCFAVAAGWTNYNFHVKHGSTLQKSQAFKIARKAYYQCCKMIHSIPRIESRFDTSTTSTRGGKVRKREDAMAWLNETLKPSSDQTNVDVQQKTTDSCEHVQAMSKRDLHELYKQDHQDGSTASKTQQCGQVAGYHTFTRAANDLYRKAGMGRRPILGPTVAAESLIKIKYHKWSVQGQCATCTVLKELSYNARRRGQLADAKYFDKQREKHQERARMERLCYHIRIKRALTCFWTLSMAIDGLNKSTSAGFQHHTKPLAELKGVNSIAGAKTIEYKMVGVLVHGIAYHLYIADPRIPSNGNFTIECMYQTLLKVLSSRQVFDEIFIQLDAAPDNKNNAVFCFAEWLVQLGVAKLIKITFLIVGHTHIDIDQKFVAITYQMRRSTVISVNDLIVNCWEAYRDEAQMPDSIEVISVVSDWKRYLYDDCGNPVGGFGNRRKIGGDETRPHQFWSWSKDGTCASNYKWMATDGDFWGDEEFQWMHSMPADPTPPMQWFNVQQSPAEFNKKEVFEKNLIRLAENRAAVLRNFQLKHKDLQNPCLTAKLQPFFTAENRKYIDDLYDSFLTDTVVEISEQDDGKDQKEQHTKIVKKLDFNKLKCTMRSAYKFQPLKVQLQQAPEELSLELKRPDVPPVYHNQGWSQVQRDTAEKTYLETFRAEIKNDPESLAFCEAADKEIKRATKHMHSKAALIPELERQVKEQVMGRMNLESNAPKIYDCDILGGAVHLNCMLYLINTGDEVVWVHDHQVDQTALDSVRENLVNEAITVWWHDKRHVSKPTAYSGRIVAFRKLRADRHEVLYEDKEVDFLQLLTLDVEHDRDDEDSIIRVMWMLQRPDLDAETLSKQLDIDKVKEIHKRKAQFFNRSKKSEVAPKKRQTNPLAKKKRKKPQKEQELFESSDALSELHVL